MVDPFWEVTPLKAVTETVTQFVLRPLEVAGTSIGKVTDSPKMILLDIQVCTLYSSGVFFNELIAPIPFFWKVPVLVIGAAIILLLVVMACGYRDEQVVYQILISNSCTGFSSEIGTKLRDWAVGQAWGSCYSWAALSSNDSKTL